MKTFSILIIVFSFLIRCNNYEKENSNNESELNIQLDSCLILNQEFYLNVIEADSFFLNNLKRFDAENYKISKSTSFIRIMILGIGNTEIDALITFTKSNFDSMFTLENKTINSAYNIKRDSPTEIDKKILGNNAIDERPFDSLIIYLKEADFWNLKPNNKIGLGSFGVYLEAYHEGKYNLIKRRGNSENNMAHAKALDNFYHVFYYYLETNLFLFYHYMFSENS